MVDPGERDADSWWNRKQGEGKEAVSDSNKRWITEGSHEKEVASKDMTTIGEEEASMR